MTTRDIIPKLTSELDKGITTEAQAVYLLVGIRKIIERVGPERRGQVKHPNLVLVHGPIHASWLNQIEIYFSILQRKVLTPNDFSSLQELAQRLLAFGRHYQTIAKPFEWRFTRKDLTALLRKLHHPVGKAA